MSSGAAGHVRLRENADVGARHAAHLRGLNLERVLAIAMDRHGPFTRSELIGVTGLSAPTVGSLVTHLIREGLVKDLGTGPSRGGRRPAFMEFNDRYGFVAGIDLGPSRTRLAVADLRGQRLAHRVLDTPRGVGPAALLARLAAALRALLKDAHVPPGRLLAVAAGAPGAVDRHRGVVVALAPNLKGWSKPVPMASLLKRALGAPVVVENDMNLAIVGERWRGAAQGHDTCAYVTVGTGIGAGIMVDGHLHRGHHFLAGEIALMCMGPQHVGVDFGSHGCLETLAGLDALAARWDREAGRANGWVGDLVQAAQAGDRKARTIVEETATLLGIAIANLCLVVDPSLVVLGGALIAQGGPLLDDVRRIVARIIPTPSQIVPSALGEEAPLWGSLLVATQEARVRLRQRLRHARAAE